MAFTLEDGSGVTGANGYIDITFADEYHTDRGHDAWDNSGTTTIAQKQTAIIKASEYIDKRFGKQFIGFRRLKDQGLEWPRLDAFDLDGFLMSGIDEIPRQLKKATAEYALRALILTNLLPDPTLPFATRDSTGSGATQVTNAAAGEVSRIREQVGPIERDIEYRTYSQSLENQLNKLNTGTNLVPGLLLPAYPEADLWIEELLVSFLSRDLARG